MNSIFKAGNKVKLLLHIVVWVILFVFPSYLLYIDSKRDVHFLFLNYVQITFYIIIFYINFLWLIPQLFFKKRRFLYSILAVLLLVVMSLIMNIANEKIFMNRGMPSGRMLPPPDRHEFRLHIPPPPEGNGGPRPSKSWPTYNFLLISILISGFSLGLRISEKLSKNEKLRKEAEKEKLHSELVLLKSQIDPHFLFNSLNTIYSLSLNKSDLTPDAIMKLSDMMRYVLQEVQHEKVTLEKEIQYISQYVEFQKLRLGENVDLELKINIDSGRLEISPMILIPFVENAFKFGTSSHEKSSIKIELSANNKSLDFNVSNFIFPGRENSETFGIGVKNTKHRLQLIYPEKHTLNLTNDGKTFNVHLKIQLV